jgi:rod shape-determining protein MreC
LAVYRRTARPRFVLLLLVLTAVTLVTLDARSNGAGVLGEVRSRAQDLFAPVQDSVHSALQPVGNFLSGAFNYGSLSRENARLRDALARARGAELDAAEARREEELLLQQQHLDFVGSIPTVAASVVDATSSNFEQTIQIDRGTDSGVAVGMPVVGGPGLVGRVVSVSTRRATVLLVTDPTFSVGVRLPTSDVAVASGTGRSSPMRLDLVDPSVKAAVGALLVTSGLQLERFPPGIPVGTIRTVASVPGALQQDVTVNPVVDSNRLEFVRVLQWSPQ